MPQMSTFRMNQKVIHAGRPNASDPGVGRSASRYSPQGSKSFVLTKNVPNDLALRNNA